MGARVGSCHPGRFSLQIGNTTLGVDTGVLRGGLMRDDVDSVLYIIIKIHISILCMLKRPVSCAETYSGMVIVKAIT